MLASFSRRDVLRTPLQRSTCWNSSDVAVVTLMPVIARWESPLSRSNRFACAATPLPRACTRVLVRSRCSFWVRQSWCCCLAVRSGMSRQKRTPPDWFPPRNLFSDKYGPPGTYLADKYGPPPDKYGPPVSNVFRGNTAGDKSGYILNNYKNNNIIIIQKTTAKVGYT